MMNEPNKLENDQAFIAYPTNTLFAIIDTSAGAEAAVNALAAVGFGADAVKVFSGEAGAQQIDASGAQHGLLAQLLRIYQRTTSEHDQAVYYEQALREGRYVIAVHNDEADARQQVRTILKAQGGHFINFYGRLATQKLDL